MEFDLIIQFHRHIYFVLEYSEYRLGGNLIRKSIQLTRPVPVS
jgi:hypothetical protein